MKKKLQLFWLLFLPLFIFSQVPTNGLVAYYPFNGNANDESGNANHGTVNGATLATDRFENAARAYSFVNNSIEINSNVLSKTTYSISGWFKRNGLSSGWNNLGIIFTNGSLIHGSYGSGCWVFVNSNSIGYEEAPNYQGNLGATITNDDKWHHFTQISMKGEYTKLFFDGELVSQGTYNNNSDNIAFTQPLTFGRGFQGSLDFAFNGVLDDFRIYNRALSDTEVKNLYDSEKVVMAPSEGLMVHYPFTDLSGQNVIDNTNNANVSVANSTSDRNGNLNSALLLNGNSEFVQIPYNNNLLPATGAKTYSFWLKFNTSENNMFMFQNGDADYSGGQFRLEVSRKWDNCNFARTISYLHSYWGYGGGSSADYMEQTVAIDLTQFHHYSYIIDNKTVKYFIDGVLVGTKDWNLPYLPYNSNFNIEIGRFYNSYLSGYAHYFNGVIDDIKIYNRALTDSEIQNLYEAEKPINQNTTNSCVNWTSPPTGEALSATNFLCSNNVIDHTQNGNTNASQAILRQDLAKILHRGLYMGEPVASPADDFPVPFNDMQVLSGNEYWYRAVKNLGYLQYADDKTAFDRDFINFNPQKPIERRYSVKAILETFNIPKSNDVNNPFNDVNTNDETYGYVKKAYELGLTTQTTFRPTESMTREEAFIMLWRLLKSPCIAKPTAAQLADPANYFIPGNYRTATLGKAPDVSQGNFNHYQKTSFSIAGRGVGLDFTHTYNSFLTELPKGFLKIENDDNTSVEVFTPVGIGWTHTYNVYAVKQDAYTNGSVTEPAKLYFFYPDGSINVYLYDTLQPDATSVGLYDTLERATTADGERITVTTKGQIKYVFENRENGRSYFIQSIRDRNSNGVKINWVKNTIAGISYHKINTVQEIFTDDSVGRSLAFAYHPDYPIAITSVTDNSIGRSIEFTYEASGNLLSYKDPKGQITNYKYEASDNYNTSNLLSEIILPKGNKIKNTYFQRKLKSSETFGENGVSTSTTNVDWKPSYSGSEYNTNSKVTDAQGKKTAYSHNSLGNPTKIAKLDASGNELAEGKTEFLSYATGNNANLPTEISISGQSSSVNYDSKGNLLSVSKNGITNIFTYTAFNDVDTHKDANGNVTDYNYDVKGNLTEVKRPSIGGSTTIERNTFGQVTKVTNPAGITTQFSYDINGLTNKITLPLGIETSSEYDNASRLLKTIDALGKVNTFVYDANDNLTKSTDANNGVVKHTYDANDNHLTVTNQKNETQTNTYNFDDDMLASETFGSHTKSYTYNTDGSLATHTRGNGTFTYTYDDVTGRLNSDGYTNYTYDVKGNIKTIANTNGTVTLNYDVNDRLESYTDIFGNVVKYGYDNNNNVTSVTYPNNKIVTYAYDALNRCTTVTDWNGKTTSYNYLIDDRISKITLPNGTYTQYSYDAAGRPTGISNKKSDGSIISEYAFTLDKAGNHTQEIVNEPSISSGLQNLLPHTDIYGEYPYNRIQNQNSTSFSHNTAGGITQAGNDAFTYDIYDNVLTATGSINGAFKYDGAGNRREKTIAGNTTRYVLSVLGMSQVLAETDANNVANNYYVYGPTGLLYRLKTDNSYSYYHYDYRGSTTAITNDAQNITHSYSYDPFGKVLAKTETDANPYQYVGKYGVQYESPTLTFMRARYYNPNIGRFISEDPIWALNLYPYADNNPIMKIDFNGGLAFKLPGTEYASLLWDLGLVYSDAYVYYEEYKLNMKNSLYFTKYGNHWYNQKNYKAAGKFYEQATEYARNAEKAAGKAKKRIIFGSIEVVKNLLLSYSIDKLETFLLVSDSYIYSKRIKGTKKAKEFLIKNFEERLAYKLDTFNDIKDIYEFTITIIEKLRENR